MFLRPSPATGNKPCPPPEPKAYPPRQVLALALGASFGIQSWIEGGVIAGIITLNIVIGFIQDFQAARTIDALGALTSPSARVFRDDKAEDVPSADLVPGDIVELKMGDSVPADVRLIEAMNFETDEALLTGESLPIRKDPSLTFADETGPGDRINTAFSSSVVTKGRARGIVFATGMSTEIGAIAAALRQSSEGKKVVLERNEKGNVTPWAIVVFCGQWLWKYIGNFLGLTVGTPLQKKLSALFLYIFGLAIIFAIIVLAGNKMNTRNDVIIYAVATGVGTLPVSLILVLTITLAAGTKAMVERNVVVRQLSSLEALGGVTSEFPPLRHHCPPNSRPSAPNQTLIRSARRHLLRQDWHPHPGPHDCQDGVAPRPGHLRRRERDRALQPHQGRRQVHAQPARRHAL